MKNTLLLINPKSRRGAETYPQIVQILSEQGFRIVNTQSELEQNSFAELIERYHQKVDFVSVGGGDGSVNEALPKLVAHNLLLHVIPLGTANNLARTLNMPLDLVDNLKSLGIYKTKKITIFDNERS